MITIHVRNVHQALPEGLRLLAREGISRPSRNGPVLQMPEPVATIYEKPCERVLFHPWRDANPFFHFYESLWMLAGRRDLAPLTRYVRNFGQFSDDGETLNAAYGYRWRHATWLTDVDGRARDQLPVIIDELRRKPESRQCVLQIWDQLHDLGRETKDHACNLTATFQIGPTGRLDMSLFCRSNDMILGGYGANAVHFSMLMEYVALHVGVEVGTLTQISVNYHVYEEPFKRMWNTMLPRGLDQPYDTPLIVPRPIVSPGVSRDEWDDDVRKFVTDSGRAPHDWQNWDPHDWWFRDVACPIVEAHDYHRDGDTERAIRIVKTCTAGDWREACVQWLERRRLKTQEEGREHL